MVRDRAKIAIDHQ